MKPKWPCPHIQVHSCHCMLCTTEQFTDCGRLGRKHTSDTKYHTWLGICLQTCLLISNKDYDRQQWDFIG
jgi:hypothetical protein